MLVVGPTSFSHTIVLFSRFQGNPRPSLSGYWSFLLFSTSESQGIELLAVCHLLVFAPKWLPCTAVSFHLFGTKSSWCCFIAFCCSFSFSGVGVRSQYFYFWIVSSFLAMLGGSSSPNLTLELRLSLLWLKLFSLWICFWYWKIAYLRQICHPCTNPWLSLLWTDSSPWAFITAASCKAKPGRQIWNIFSLIPYLPAPEFRPWKSTFCQIDNSHAPELYYRYSATTNPESTCI